MRTWCDVQGRTPRIAEQADIAARQQALIDAAAADHDVVVCDTTPLMTAVYSERIFNDRSLQADAAARQKQYALTLLTALDIAWQPDSQRDGPHVRVPVDGIIRRLLTDHALPWALVAGQGSDRLESALNAVAPILRRHTEATQRPTNGLFSRLAERDAAQPAWHWLCETCDSPECEHQLQRLRAAQDKKPALGK